MRRAGEVCYVDAHNRMGCDRGEVCFGSREIMHKAKDELNGYDINGKRIEMIIKVCPRTGRSRVHRTLIGSETEILGGRIAIAITKPK